MTESRRFLLLAALLAIGIAARTIFAAPQVRASEAAGLFAMNIEASIDADGVMHARVSETLNGEAATRMRTYLRRVPEAVRLEALREVRWSGADIALASLVSADLDSPGPALGLSYVFTSRSSVDWAQNWLTVPMPSALSFEAPDPKRPASARALRGSTRVHMRIGMPTGFDGGLQVERANLAPFSSAIGTATLTLNDPPGAIEIEQHTELRTQGIPANRLDEFERWRAAATMRPPAIALIEQWPCRSESEPRVAWLPGEIEEANILVLEARGKAPAIAMSLLERALVLDPRHPSARAAIGTIQRQLGSDSEGLLSIRRQIQDAATPAAYKVLGLAFAGVRRFDQALPIFTEGARRFPEDRDLPALLGEYLVRSGAYARAMAVLQQEILRRPRSSRLHAWLARAAARNGDAETAVAESTKAVALEPTADIWIMAANALADVDRETGRAREYATNAISQVRNDTSGANLATRSWPLAHRLAASRLAAAWDALGWVLFREGKLDLARDYCLAAWQTSLSGETADHVGQIEEARRNLPAAATYYTYAALGGPPGLTKSIDRMNRLIPPDARRRAIDNALASQAELQTTEINLPVLSAGEVPVVLLVGLDGIVTDSTTSSDDAGLKPVVRSLTGLQILSPAPGDLSTTRLIRSGVLTCRNTPARGCSLRVHPAFGSLGTD